MLVRLLNRDPLLLLTAALKHCIKDYIRVYLAMVLNPILNDIPVSHGTIYFHLIINKGRSRLSDDLKRFSDVSY